ncbi:MAG: hypothetical protein ACC707_15250 [Thiohalomonadales bacterium]
MIYRVSILLCAMVLSLSAHAVTAFQDQVKFAYKDKDSLSGLGTEKKLSANFLHYLQLVNPFAGPVDEAAFLNRIGSIGAGFSYVQVNTDIDNLGSVNPNGIAFDFEYNYVFPNKPLTASIKYARESIEETAGGSLLEGKSNLTELSVGLYLDLSSHINFSVFNRKMNFREVNVQDSKADASSLQLAYKKVWVNPGKKSFNLEFSYASGDQQLPGSTQTLDFSVIGLLGDVYFSAQSKLGLGYSLNSDNNAAIGDSSTIVFRGATYFDSINAIGFDYYNTKFDIEIDNKKSFLVYYKRLMK